MDRRQCIEQVAGILYREGLAFQTRSDGGGYRLLFGSAGVFVDFASRRDGSVVVTVSSPVLMDVDPEGPGAAYLHTRLNKLNRRHRFLKFVLVGHDLVCSSDLLGDDVHAKQLLNAVNLVAAAAMRLGDKLADRVGGKRYATMLEELAAEESESE